MSIKGEWESIYKRGRKIYLKGKKLLRGFLSGQEGVTESLSRFMMHNRQKATEKEQKSRALVSNEHE